MPPTPPNRKHAARLVKEINEKITSGTFKYGDYFPDSIHAVASPSSAGVALSIVGERWLKTKGRLAGATRSQYKNALNFWYRSLGGEDTHIASIRHGDLAAFIGDYEWPSAKLCNNYLIALRGIFALARRDRFIIDDPMDGIENTKMQAPLPDPFTLDEAEQILTDLFKHYPEPVGNYFEYAFFTGQRPEETVAQSWQDMDWHLETVRVQKAKSFRGQLKPVKGYSARDIELSSRALAALRRQKAHTFLKSHGFVFENPLTNAPWHDGRSQRETYWQPALKRLGIRYRGPYHTRHTYATAAIMQGCKPVWIAKQMGNSPLMIFKHYAKWLEKADKSEERGKFEGAINRLKTG
jgi:integrase